MKHYLFVVNFTVAAIALFAWGVAYWIMKEPIEGRKKQIENEAADNVQKKALLLKKQLLGQPITIMQNGVVCRKALIEYAME